MVNTLAKFKSLKDSEQLILAYQGVITESLVINLLKLAENKLAMVEYNSRLKKKVFNILVETLQNIYHNQSDIAAFDKSNREILVMLIKDKQTYQIWSGNYIIKDHMGKLKKRIDEINLLNHEELREKYRARLDEGVISEAGRAGLGIMDMVRKSGFPLTYGFDSINDKFSYFSLLVNINH